MSEAIDGTAANTDRELWREREGDYYADSIHVTEGGGIGIDCGGTVYVRPLRTWHSYASRLALLDEAVAALRGIVRYAQAARYTVGVGTTQAERLRRAEAILARIDALEKGEGK